MELTKEAIKAYIDSGDITVTRAQGELTGIYASQQVQRTLDPMKVQSALIQATTREHAPFDLGKNIYHLSTSDFIREYGDAVLADAQQPAPRSKSSGYLPGLPG